MSRNPFNQVNTERRTLRAHALALRDLQRRPIPRARLVKVIIDGGGSVLAEGVAGDVFLDFAGTITGWTLLADQEGDLVVDIWKSTYADFPPDVSDSITDVEPELSAQQKNQESDLSGWDTDIEAGDCLRINVDSAATVTRVTLALSVDT